MPVDEILKLRALCGYYDLDGREILLNYSPARLTKIYNGAGPDSWSEESRALLTDKMDLFKPVILIHDVQFQESDGMISTFRDICKTWKINTRKILDAEYPLLSLKMLKREYRLHRAYWLMVKKLSDLAISSRPAEDAYVEAYQRRMKL